MVAGSGINDGTALGTGGTAFAAAAHSHSEQAPVNKISRRITRSSMDVEAACHAQREAKKGGSG
jgi:hypothetical protein